MIFHSYVSLAEGNLYPHYFLFPPPWVDPGASAAAPKGRGQVLQPPQHGRGRQRVLWEVDAAARLQQAIHVAEDLLGTMVSVKTGIMGTYDNIFYTYIYIYTGEYNTIYILGSKSLGIPIIGGLIHVHTRDRLSHLCFPRSFILTHIQIKGGSWPWEELMMKISRPYLW